MVEFYYDERELKDRIDALDENLNEYTMYLPASRVRGNADFDKAKIQIKQDLKERINTFLEKCDHSFAIGNFDYV